MAPRPAGLVLKASAGSTAQERAHCGKQVPTPLAEKAQGRPSKSLLFRDLPGPRSRSCTEQGTE